MIVVVGGGAVGLCVAEALSSRGADDDRDRARTLRRRRVGWERRLDHAVAGDPGAGPRRDRRSRCAGSSTRPARCGSGRRCRRRCWAGSRRSSRGARDRRTSGGRRAAGRGRRWPVPRSIASAERGVEFELHDEPLLYPAFAQASSSTCSRSPTSCEPRARGQSLAELSAGGRAQGRAGARCRRRRRRARRGEQPRAAGGARSPGSSGRSRPRGVRGAGARARDGADLGRRTVAQCVTRRRLRAMRRGHAVIGAAGVQSAELLGAARVRVPIVAAKGYSRTYCARTRAARGARSTSRARRSRSAPSTGASVCRERSSSARGRSTLSSRRLAAITAAAQQAMPGWRMPPDPR